MQATSLQKPKTLAVEPETRVDWSLLHQDIAVYQAYKLEMNTAVQTVPEDKQLTPTAITDVLMDAVEQTLQSPVHTMPDWFTQNEHLVAPLRNHYLRAMRCYDIEPTDHNKRLRNVTRNRYLQAKRRAKRNYFESMATKITQNLLRRDSKQAF